MNLRHPADEPFDIHDLLLTVCYYFTSNNFYKVMQRQEHDDPCDCSRSNCEDSEILDQRMTDVFAGSEPPTVAWTLGKSEAVIPLSQGDRCTRPGEHLFQDSEHSAAALRECDSAYEHAGSFHPWTVLPRPLFIVPAPFSGYFPKPPDPEAFQVPPDSPLTSAYQCQDHFQSSSPLDRPIHSAQ